MIPCSWSVEADSALSRLSATYFNIITMLMLSVGDGGDTLGWAHVLAYEETFIKDARQADWHNRLLPSVDRRRRRWR